MRREKLADCEIGDWVAAHEAEDIELPMAGTLQTWSTPEGERRYFIWIKVNVPGGAEYAWARYDPAKPLPLDFTLEVPG